MKTLSVFLCPILLASAVCAEPPRKLNDQALTLSAVTQEALTNNRSIREARARWEALKARVPQAGAWDDLKVSASTRAGRFVDIAPNGFADQMFSVEQMIPISGKNLSRARIAAAEALSGLERLRRAEIDVAMNVKAAYIQLANGHAQLELNRANETSLRQTLDVSRSRFEAAAQSQTDVLSAEAELARISEVSHDLERAVSEGETRLNVLMNRDAFSSVGKPASELPAHAVLSIERLRGLALNNRPEVRIARAEVSGAKARIELSNREWIPDPSITVQAQRYNEASQAVSEVDAGISFSVPWFNGKKYRAGEREAKSGADAAQSALENAQNDALGLLRNQITKIETFHQHVELFQDRLIPNARQSVDTNRTGYEGAKSSLLDLIASERSLREAEAMRRQHLADYQMALAELEALVGADLGYFGSEKVSEKRRSK